MSNSPLVVHTRISPNKNVNRNNAIERISPHCVVGQVTAESLGNWFADESTQSSSNYGIDKDARVAMYVEEKDRSWCTSSRDNDHKAVTIECASDTKHPYEMNDIVYKKLIELCVDICKRNGKTKLLWIDDKDKALSYKLASNEMLITVHRWFANKSCPGDWLYQRLGDLAVNVTAQLNPVPEIVEEEKTTYTIQVGAFSKIEKANELKEKMTSAGFASFIVKSSDGFHKVQYGEFGSYEDARMKIKEVRKAGFDSFITKSVKASAASKPNVADIKIGDKVKLQNNAPVYGETRTFAKFVYAVTLYVRHINGDRVVVSTNQDGPLTGAVDKKYLTKV